MCLPRPTWIHRSPSGINRRTLNEVDSDLMSFAARGLPGFEAKQAPPRRQNSGVVKAGIFAIRSMSRFAAPEMTGWNRLPITLLGQQFNKPGFVLDLLI